jgi:protease-4
MKNKRVVLGLVIAGAAFVFIIFPLILFALLTAANDSTPWGEGVGLVEVEGVILDSRETVRQLVDMEKDERVKAVVLRVDSPGGVVAPSQEIYAGVKRLSAKKKVVVSMGSLAASGGYYIAAPASVIMANPGTITGSIGVLMKISNIEELMGKVGVKAYTLKTGEYKDSGSPLRVMTSNDREMLQEVINSAHNQFVRAVAEGRRLPVENVRNIADGRIFSGEQALALKLIDRIGTLQDAVEEAGRLGGIRGEPQVICPAGKRDSWIDMLMEGTASRIAESVRKERGLSLRYEIEGAIR